VLLVVSGVGIRIVPTYSIFSIVFLFEGYFATDETATDNISVDFIFFAENQPALGRPCRRHLLTSICRAWC